MCSVSVVLGGSLVLFFIFSRCMGGFVRFFLGGWYVGGADGLFIQRFHFFYRVRFSLWRHGIRGVSRCLFWVVSFIFCLCIFLRGVICVGFSSLYGVGCNERFFRQGDFPITDRHVGNESFLIGGFFVRCIMNMMALMADR